MLIIQLIHCTERSKEDRVHETHDFLKMPSEFMNNIIIKGFKIKILITKYFKGIYKEKGFSVHTHTHTLSIIAACQCSGYLLGFTDFCLAVTSYEFRKKEHENRQSQKRQSNLWDICCFSSLLP